MYPHLDVGVKFCHGDNCLCEVVTTDEFYAVWPNERKNLETTHVLFRYLTGRLSGRIHCSSEYNDPVAKIVACVRHAPLVQLADFVGR